MGRVARSPAVFAITVLPASVTGIAAICKRLNIRVLAEGIETRAERDFLLSTGITLMQGYWFAKPGFRKLSTMPDSAWR